MKKGFTLIELLVVILIIAIIGGMGVILFKDVLKIGEKDYYSALESNVLVAGNDYYLDHRDKLPSNDELTEISLGDLVDSDYIEPIKDSDGNLCKEGKVYAYRENNKYVYEVCLECSNYQSDGKHCQKFTLPE